MNKDKTPFKDARTYKKMRGLMPNLKFQTQNRCNRLTEAYEELDWVFFTLQNEIVHNPEVLEECKQEFIEIQKAQEQAFETMKEIECAIHKAAHTLKRATIDWGNN